MSVNRLRPLLQHLQKLAGAPAPTVPDRELLHRFIVHREELAFAALVERHGSLVLGVCRRVLRHQQDAEDAFQATFLVLAIRARLPTKTSTRAADALPLTVVLLAPKETHYEEIVKVFKALTDAKVAKIELELSDQEGISAVIRAGGDTPYKTVLAAIEVLHAAGVRNVSLRKVDDDGKIEESNDPNKPLTDSDDAIDFLKKKGVQLGRDKSGLVVQALLPSHFSLTPEAIGHLQQLPKLSWLTCNADSLWSVDEFKQLATLRSLEQFEVHANRKCSPMPWKLLGAVRCVRLSGDGIDDSLLEAVSEMQALTSIHLNQVAATPNGLAHLKRLRNLDSVVIQGSKVTAEGVKQLSEIDKLKSLTLCGNDIGPAGFAHLSKLAGLTYLNLESTHCTDDDVAALKPLMNLTDLDLGYNPGVTDAGLRRLVGLKKLAGLRLYETNVTDNGVAELRKALPKLVVWKSMPRSTPASKDK